MRSMVADLWINLVSKLAAFKEYGSNGKDQNRQSGSFGVSGRPLGGALSNRQQQIVRQQNRQSGSLFFGGGAKW